ncbi:MAG: polynucleotide adenylyltransferase PcnB [Pseudomonadales bacterium]|jgi:poly(A) polymerase
MVQAVTSLAKNLPTEHISVNALKVINRLTEHGYEAYLVGGCVRDLLLGNTPKDFDVSTNAHPEEVRELFRNSRMIGRRFRIVHVRFGRDIIEVATFRGPHKEIDEDSHSEGGMILDDNVYGSFEEDVHRRDFTMNALYYNVDSQEIIDLVGGLADIEAKRIRLIGKPEDRYREDPVRMLRAVRFKAKLGFDIEQDSAESVVRLAHLLQDIPPARIFEEVLKLFMSAHGVETLNAMLEYEVFSWLFPATHRCMEGSRAEKLISLSLASTDKRIAIDKPVTPAFIFAALLWHPFIEQKAKLEEEGLSSVEASHEAATTVIAAQQLFTSIPRRFSGPIKEIWNLQFRLPMRQGKKPDVLLGHKRFRAAYDFLLLREESGEDLDGLGEWWTKYQEADGEAQANLKQTTAGRSQNKRKRKRQNPAENGQDQQSNFAENGNNRDNKTGNANRQRKRNTNRSDRNANRPNRHANRSDRNASRPDRDGNRKGDESKVKDKPEDVNGNLISYSNNRGSGNKSYNK